MGWAPTVNGADAQAATVASIANLPRPDDATLRAYLLNVADTICRKLNTGLQGDAPLRLRECATIIARVAQHLGAAGAAPDALAEAAALSAMRWKGVSTRRPYNSTCRPILSADHD